MANVNIAKFHSAAVVATALVDENRQASVPAKAAFTALGQQLNTLIAQVNALVAAALEGWSILTIAANAVTPDLANGRAFKLTVNQATQVTINNPIWTGGTIISGTRISIFVFTDATALRPTPAWGNKFGTDVTEEFFDHTNAAVRYSVVNLIYQDDNKWHRTTDVPTGLPL